MVSRHTGAGQKEGAVCARQAARSNHPNRIDQAVLGLMTEQVATNPSSCI
jgi:hypothetical protein